MLASSDAGTHNVKQQLPNDFPEVGKNQTAEPVQTASPNVSRPSSNYSNRSQGISLQKGMYLDNGKLCCFDMLCGTSLNI